MKLERQKIVNEALALLNEVGIEQMTTRRLAERLGVRQPALYWHFKNKNALLDAMNSEILRSGHTRTVPAPDEAWDVFLLENARSFRRALLSYRDGARVHAGNEPSLDMLHDSESQFRCLRDAGFDETTSVYALIAIGNYVVGSVLEQQAAIDRPLPAELPPEAVAKAPQLFEIVARLMADGADATADRSFEAGLGLIVEGLRLRLAKEWVKRTGGAS